MRYGYQFQVNSPNNPHGLRGALQISLIGEKGTISNINVQSGDGISAILHQPILFEVEHTSLGELQTIELQFLGFTKSETWWLESIEILALNNRQHSYFHFGQLVKSGESIFSGNKDRKRRGKFEVFKGKDKQYYFHLKAANGEIIAASEGYPSLSNARKGIASIKYNAESSPVIERV